MQFNKLTIMDNAVITEDSKNCVLSIVFENGNKITIEDDYFDITVNPSAIRISSNSKSLSKLIAEIKEKVTEDFDEFDFYIIINSIYIRSISVNYI
jgi:hypothetical protein